MNKKVITLSLGAFLFLGGVGYSIGNNSKPAVNKVYSTNIENKNLASNKKGYSESDEYKETCEMIEKIKSDMPNMNIAELDELDERLVLEIEKYSPKTGDSIYKTLNWLELKSIKENIVNEKTIREGENFFDKLK